MLSHEAGLRLEKQRINSTGEKNNMFGKPSPSFSYRGWCGQYKENKFRSLKELCFMLDMDDKNITYESAEYIQIPYIGEKGQNRNYLPDFIVGNCIIEIKPKRLHQRKDVQTKFKALKKHCKKNKLDCKMIDVEIDFDRILKAYNQDLIKFDSKSQTKFDKRKKKFYEHVY